MIDGNLVVTVSGILLIGFIIWFFFSGKKDGNDHHNQ